MLGLFNIDKNEWESFKKLNTNVSEEFIMKKIDERNKAKKNNDYDLADKIREDLLSKGISIEDLKDKTVWKLK